MFHYYPLTYAKLLHVVPSFQVLPTETQQAFIFSPCVPHVLPISIHEMIILLVFGGVRGSAIGSGATLRAGRLRIRYVTRSLRFFIDLESFRLHYGPGVDSASTTKEYQVSSLRGKDSKCVGLTTLPPLCDECLNILGA